MSTYYAGLLAEVGVLLLGGLSVYIILATGQLSLGNAGFMGIGAYLASYLTVRVGIPLTLALVVAAVAAGVIGVIVGFPALRLKGIYLAMATLGFGEMVRSFFLNFSPMGGSGGFHGMQHVSVSYIWAWAGGILLVVMVLERSRVWLEMRAVHDDETAAGLVGLNTTVTKVGAFGFGAAVAAVAGGLFAHHHVYIEPGNFGFERSIEFVLAVILGGSTVGPGALVGSTLLVFLPENAAVPRRLAARRFRHPAGRDAAGAPARHPRPRAVSADDIPKARRMKAPSSPALLQLTDVSKSFGGIQALADVSCDVPRGQIIGIIGPNGAGKTTLFNVITGAYRASAGEVAFDGEIITAWPSHRIARAGIARTFQNIRLFAGMTVFEHLLVAQPHREATLRRLLPTRWADPAALSRAEEVLDFFGLEAVRDRLARSLPYGSQRKVEMARALTARPKLLLLDEPVAGMNAEEADEVRTRLLQLRATGLTILLIEHDMTFVMKLCDYLYVLDFGALIAEGRPAEVRNNPVVLDAYLGSEA
jgi:branched-chain amino acid transport system permease protein